MGGRAGGSGSGIPKGIGRDTTYKGKIEDVEDLVKVKDPRMYKALKEAFSNFSAKLGVPEKNVKLAKLSGSVLGIGGHGEVFLNKRYFNKSVSEFKNVMKENYDAGHLTKTNKPLAHVLTHELAHASWQSGRGGTKNVAAGKEINSLFSSFQKKGGKGYGKYAYSNVDEFWAEVSTKAAHGVADRYTKATKQIYKKYQL